MIHILGAPRTGSTLLYQLIVNHFRVNYYANNGEITNTDADPVPLYSVQGKTRGQNEPSEASMVLARWWGKMATPIPEMRQRMITTLTAAEPIVFKNIWNVYRIDAWLEMFPDTKFIHIRRNAIAAGVSYQRSMKKQGHGLNEAYLKFGNSEEKVLNEFTQVDDIDRLIIEKMSGRDYLTVWYDYLCNQTGWELLRLEKYLKVERRKSRYIPDLVCHDD